MPFHVQHDVIDQNHGKLHVGGLFSNSDCEFLFSRCYVVIAEFLNEFTVPIIALSQLSRTIDGRIDPKPMLSDLRDSGSIEQDADLVLMLYKNKQKSVTNLTPGSAIIDVSIAKQRNGPIGDTQLLFNQYLTKFEDYDKNEPYNPI